MLNSDPVERASQSFAGRGAGLRVCLISHDARDEAKRPSAALAELLATRHEVTLIDHGGTSDGGSAAGSTGTPVREIVAEPSEELAATALASEGHRRSAAVLEAIERAYGDEGPQYLEACDRGAPALVPLQARRGGHRSLRETKFGVRMVGSAELTGLHNAALADPGMQLLCDLERAQLRLADRLIWPGGDVLELYRRYYGETLPGAARIAMPLGLPAERPPSEGRDPSGPLRILYSGPLSRGKGAADLAEACLRLPRDDWRLTMIGADTPTAFFKQSMRHSIEAMFGDDPRIAIEDPVPDDELATLMGEHDLLVAPPRCDVWPAEVLEAMSADLPVLATPVGGLAEIVELGVTGWLTADTGPAAIRAEIGDLLERREELERVRESGAARARSRLLADPDRILDAYQELFDELERGRASVARPARRAREPLVSGVVPYFRASAHVEEAVGSLFAQTHGNMEAIIVNDGSFEVEDEVLQRLTEREGVRVVTQLNSGEAAARNLGTLLAEGDFLLMLDADNVAEPEFVARALEVLRHEPELAYVSCWLRFIAADGSPLSEPAGYAPLGNSVVREEDENWDGDTFALIDRRLFTELGYRHETEASTHTDWELYRRLREDRRFGMVIPERLARYRFAAGSLTRSFTYELQRRAWEEARDRRIRRRTRWTAEA